MKKRTLLGIVIGQNSQDFGQNKKWVRETRKSFLKLTVLSLLICFSTIAYSQTVGEKPMLPVRSIYVNPLGLLQFGPVLAAEFRISNSTLYLVPHVRYGYLGLLTHAYYRSIGADYVSPWNNGIGIQLKGFFRSQYNRNVGYLAFGTEYNGGSIKFNSNTVDEEKQIFAGLLTFVNTGFRWRFESERFLSLGVIIGINSPIYDQRFYTSNDLVTAEFDENTLIGMLELAFGWENR